MSTETQTDSNEPTRNNGFRSTAVAVVAGVVIGGVVLAAALAFTGKRLMPTDPPAVASAAFKASTVQAPAWEPVKVDFGNEEASIDARRLAQWVAYSGDHQRLHFVILDKKNAKVFVFGPDAKLVGASPVLLGYAPGDDSVDGIGQRAIEQVKPHERTTPAGRFVGEPGRNTLGEDVVWVDYDAAVSMHRVRATNPAEKRLERLASPTIEDNRISFGCINMPVAFYEGVLKPAFDKRYGIVYVLPEVKTLDEVFAQVDSVPRSMRVAASSGTASTL
ncbi:hypothetical protein ACO2Q9_19140 [Variovorax sp. VNK109]|uniref:hypothetical protein n=1 Tax=Variovorax sp. VNK109 TaxID=3400919 RepID=UPI003C0F711C